MPLKLWAGNPIEARGERGERREVRKTRGNSGGREIRRRNREGR
jgi:hypothetical protein